MTEALEKIKEKAFKKVTKGTYISLGAVIFLFFGSAGIMPYIQRWDDAARATQVNSAAILEMRAIHIADKELTRQIHREDMKEIRAFMSNIDQRLSRIEGKLEK